MKAPGTSITPSIALEALNQLGEVIDVLEEQLLVDVFHRLFKL